MRCFCLCGLNFRHHQSCRRGPWTLDVAKELTESWGKGEREFSICWFYILNSYFWPESINLNTIIDIFMGTLF